MAIGIVGVFYVIASMFNLYIPDTGVDHKPLKKNPLYLIHEFYHCISLLWRDKLGQISLAVTTLFWGAGATLQFIVIKWSEVALGSRPVQILDAAGRRRGRRRRRRDRRRQVHHPAQIACDVIPLGIAMGADRAGHEFRARRRNRRAAADPDRLPCPASSSCR